jgi:hypothetical protein
MRLSCSSSPLEDALKIFERLLGRVPLQAADLIGPMVNVET